MLVPPPILTGHELAQLRALVRKHAGIELGEHKASLCQARLARRLRAVGIATFGEYLALLEDPDHPEHTELVNAITTNVTTFFREPHHFNTLAKQIVPECVRDRSRTRLRVWSAGCSSGEEPWSIAMALEEAALPARWDTRILATDIDTDVLDCAHEGIYPEARMTGVSDERRRAHFLRGVGEREGWWRVQDALHARVTFRHLNLFDPWPMRGAFDVIFCRNVIIYFDDAHKAQLLRRFADTLAPGGYLMLGHSEAMLSNVPLLEACGHTTYRRKR